MSSLSLPREKMKNSVVPLLVLFLALSMLACQRSRNDRPSQKILSKTSVRFVDVDFESPISVGCDGLESYWGSDVDTLVLEDRPFLDSLAWVVSGLTQSNKGFTPDARMVVDMYFSDGTKQVLCLSNVALAVDGREMEFEPRLLDLLLRRMDSGEYK